MAIKVLERKCPQNHRCPSLKVCPTKALTQQGNKAPVVDEETCTDCGACVRSCPMGALQAQA